MYAAIKTEIMPSHIPGYVNLRTVVTGIGPGNRIENADAIPLERLITLSIFDLIWERHGNVLKGGVEQYIREGRPGVGA